MALFSSREVHAHRSDSHAPLLQSPWAQRGYLEKVLARKPAPGAGLGLILSKYRESAVQTRAMNQRAERERTLGWLEAKMVLGLLEGDPKRTRFYQELSAGGLEKQMRDGRGAEAGGLMTRPLERRFGPLALGLQTRLGALSLNRLEALAKDLVGFECLAVLGTGLPV